MRDETIYTLVPSTNRGRYALDDPDYGSDLTSGEVLAILLNGHWIEGSIGHSTMYDGPGCYHIADYGKHHHPAHDIVTKDPLGYALRRPHDTFCGYYFCGL
jgi:Domain of unknown function (DUF5348)